jgi:hypothetical protein
MIGFSVLLTVGAVLVLSCTILLVGKMFLWIIAPELDQILRLLLIEAIKNNNYGHTVTFIGTSL